MITGTFPLTLTLLCIESAVLYIAGRPRFKKYFSILPPVFWIYLVPMLASNAGIIPASHPLYSFISANLLPAALILLLISCDIKSILKLGKPALIMMLAGSLGIMTGIPLVFSFMRYWVGNDMWSGFGALSGSWIGGSANMIAVKEAVNTPDAVFMPMVIVDTIVPYAWMGVLIAGASFQKRYDSWNRSNTSILQGLTIDTADTGTSGSESLRPSAAAVLLFITVSGVLLSAFVSGRLPVVKDIISRYTWIIITSSLFGIAVSFTPAKELANRGASGLGYFLLYFVLVSIGARASVADLNIAFLLVLSGCLVVLFQAAVLIVTGRVIKAPLSLLAAASQANIGGAASAPVVAGIYRTGLAPTGLLMAILGNVLGTYCGIITAQVCRLISKG